MSDISKYVQINPYLLLEYQFNKETDVSTGIDISSIGANFGTSNFGVRTYWNGTGTNGTVGSASYGVTNNTLLLSSAPINEQRSNWYTPLDTSLVSTYVTTYYTDPSTIAGTTYYLHDTVKIHMISGYNFDDVEGILLQVGALDVSSNYVSLSNFTWAKQFTGSAVSNVLKFNSNTLQLGNKFYDKYLEFKIPSVQNLGGDTTTTLGQTLNIAALSDVHITFNTINDITNNTFISQNKTTFQLPVTSVADSFGAYIAESTAGDYIEYYATWNDVIIGSTMGQIESGQIRLYTSNNPNDNYTEFIDQYGPSATKWVLMHEVYVYEQIPPSTSLLIQKYVFTQEDNFGTTNYFRPVIPDSDIASSYSIVYICRLVNRMDGSQIIRQASFSSNNPKKYGLSLTSINVTNLVPYKVFNRVEAEQAVVASNIGIKETKYVKVFYNNTDVVLNEDNTVYAQGSGPLFLTNNDSVYKFSFEKFDNEGKQLSVDLTGFQYFLSFNIANGKTISAPATYSANMNTTAGELEFFVTQDQANQVLSNTYDTNFYVLVKNSDGSKYTFYTGKFYPVTDYFTKKITLPS